MNFYWINDCKSLNVLPYIYLDFDKDSIEDDNRFEISIGWLSFELTIGIKR